MNYWIKPRVQSTEAELLDIHRKSFRNQTSPKYEDWEIEARAQIRTYIQRQMRMNFNNNVEGAFIMGAKWAMEYFKVGAPK